LYLTKFDAYINQTFSGQNGLVVSGQQVALLNITMKNVLTLATALMTASALYAQTDSAGISKPLLNEQTRTEVNKVVDKADQVIKQQVKKTEAYQQNNALSWFDKGSMVVNGGLGFGLGAGSGAYLTLNGRYGYFFQPGFMAGLRVGFDNRLSTSFRSREFGAFARYYPFRTRINGFGGVAYNIGSESASNTGDYGNSTYNSITLEAGIGAWIRRNLGGEISLETNYYDRSNPLAGRNRGGRIKFGVNYYFGRPNR
jgi:hypothetical protein